MRWAALFTDTEEGAAEIRAAHTAAHQAYLRQYKGRIVLAGEHASYQPAWQEGAVNSALSAITRLHERALASGATA